MTSIIQYSSILAIPGALVSGLAIDFIFSYLFIPNRITLPVSLVISVLVFGLTKYYAADKANNRTSSVKDAGTSADYDEDDDDTNENRSDYNRHNSNDNNKSSHIHRPRTNILFIIGYTVALIIIVIGSFSSTIFRPSLGQIEALKLFIPWQQQFSSIDAIVKLGAAIALSFFLPGYALVSSVILRDKKRIEQEDVEGSRVLKDIEKVKSLPSRPTPSPSSSIPTRSRSNSLLKVLLGYILSVLITGLAGYIIASFGIPVSGINIILPLLVIY